MTVYGYPITYTNFKKIRKSNNESYKDIVEAVQNHISANYLKVDFYSKKSARNIEKITILS